MFDDDTTRPKAAVSCGDDLYGLSLTELTARIEALKAEIVRTEAELTKKRGEMDAAQNLFGSR